MQNWTTMGSLNLNSQQWREEVHLWKHGKQWDPFTAQVVFSIYILSSRIVTNFTIDVWGASKQSQRRLEYKNTRSMQFVSKFMKNDLLFLKTKICMKHMARLEQAIKTILNSLAFFTNGWYEIVKNFLLSKKS